MPRRFAAIGHDANLLLRRVLSIECYKPVPQGSFVEIRGTVLHVTRAYMVTGLIGTPLPGRSGPWMDALLGFAQVGTTAGPRSFPAIYLLTHRPPNGKNCTNE